MAGSRLRIGALVEIRTANVEVLVWLPAAKARGLNSVRGGIMTLTRSTPIAFIVGLAIYGSPCHADTLVSQSYGGTMSVIQNLSAHECAEAQCVAKYGLSCEDNDARERARREEDERERQAWVTAHPKQVAECKARQDAAMKGVLSTTDPAWVVEGCIQQNSFTTWATYVNPGDIKIAQCVK